LIGKNHIQHRHRYHEDRQGGRRLTIALAGNANVGKSAIFNQLTGLVQEVGNWSGKTVEVKEGRLRHHGERIKIVDLPGIYSFSTYSPEETVTREFILTRRPDVVINVVDATSLERNLYLTLQLLEMNKPVIVALNFADVARKKHLNIDTGLLSEILGAPVVNTQAIKGIGVHELIDAALEMVAAGKRPNGKRNILYGPEVENRIAQITAVLAAKDGDFPLRWSAIKALENDAETRARISNLDPEAGRLADRLCSELSSIHGEDCASVISSERYALAARIAGQVNTRPESPKTGKDRLDNLSLHPVTGYILFLATMIAILVVISFFGGRLTEVITGFFESLNPNASGWLPDILWNGGMVGFYAALSVALGFILPFFLILGWLGESG